MPIEKIVGVFFVIIVVLIFGSVITNMVTDQKCAPYISQLNQRNGELAQQTAISQQLNTNLQQCRAEYTRLITENITKKDIEDIKQDISVTKIEINNLDQKFDVVNNNFVQIYNKLYISYTIVIVINIFLVVLLIGDLVSVAFFNFDIKKKAIEWIVNKFKKHKKHEQI